MKTESKKHHDMLTQQLLESDKLKRALADCAGALRLATCALKFVSTPSTQGSADKESSQPVNKFEGIEDFLVDSRRLDGLSTVASKYHVENVTQACKCSMVPLPAAFTASCMGGPRLLGTASLSTSSTHEGAPSRVAAAEAVGVHQLMQASSIGEATPSSSISLGSSAEKRQRDSTDDGDGLGALSKFLKKDAKGFFVFSR